MPELPEVETIRRGLGPHIVGRSITDIEVLRDRAVRRQPGGADELVGRLVGRAVTGVDRRGKYLWWMLDDGAALLVHLGMSGQLVIPPADQAASIAGSATDPHVRVRVKLSDGTTVAFRDQRTFGWLWACELAPSRHDGRYVPHPATHIAPDLLEVMAHKTGPVRLAHAMQKRHSGIKRVLLNQEVVSGIGNIYADEMLWAARVNGETPADELSIRKLAALVRVGDAVLRRSITAGGTSFDALYVHVNGESGYFSRQLNAYGQAGQPCPRCGTVITRRVFMNRSSYLCPRCQR
ncbi:bifunctional DNA-formamidopyrimidine glycosylase/DNA-(apurinic or apyrimidinic site) lyase [Corynebacterium sp. TAE3-ERU12]|uniref:bifunctional DNA-formamidopyrimidine glycosylase/DNA-(apurinic or apyrimidinic site) lyase n=1 Tax=Corynebacterium sp. TAE3-ERU12 TaxID=2849491 RepID=UPI001C475DF9|nr:bifunctional DNA-formamidopyrimidine glycosylase/DNA-(apurinic or apyrimidinic site) lyase [Corynebacterium sp. TAE3-ERU12]MBV7295200.1 bifunctional DNA-formamidopyrimidine glycosylase/DNA-(apurinic or apyrimidinic site) lyase [Corynebacterium sp. TAE3-ERU12]